MPVGCCPGYGITVYCGRRSLPRYGEENEDESTRTPSWCACCGSAEFTQVSEFNRFLTTAQPPDAAASRYDYSLCHRCGVVFARVRPVGPRFQTLLERFEDTLGRPGKQGTGLDLLGSRRLTPDETARIREAAGRGVFASANGPGGPPGLPAVLRDRLAVSAHVEILGSLLTLSAPRGEFAGRT